MTDHDATVPPHVSRLLSILDAADCVTVSAADLRAMLQDIGELGGLYRREQRTGLEIAAEVARLRDCVEQAERSREHALTKMDAARKERDDWRARAEQAERVLRGDAAKTAEPSEAERWRDAPSLWEAPDGSRFQCARCARVVSAFVGSGGEYDGLCTRCWGVVTGEASKLPDPLVEPALDSEEVGDGWHHDDELPDLGTWVEVEVVDGQVLRGEVKGTCERSSMIELIGPDAAPNGGGRDGVWATWVYAVYADDEQRVRWRYIPRPSEPAPVEPLLDDEWADDGSLDVQADIDAESRAADGDGWCTDELPQLGAWVDVRVDSGDVYTGEVVSAYAGSRGLRLRGPLAAPADHFGGHVVEWCTWDDPSYPPHERRTGWRLAKRPSSEQPVEVAPEPEAERLPEGWRWDSDWAVGPEFVDGDGDTMDRMVWIDYGSVQFQKYRDEEPIAVVRAVIARHDRLARERGE